jgi:hypothetical protein
MKKFEKFKIGKKLEKNWKKIGKKLEKNWKKILLRSNIAKKKSLSSRFPKNKIALLK